jgi:hypothetical protein
MRWCSGPLVAAVAFGLTAPSLWAADKTDANAPAAPARADLLKLVPKDALGFVVVNRLGETNDKLVRLVKQLQLPNVPPVSPLDLLKGQLGLGKSLDTGGSALLVVLPGSQDPPEPIPVAFVPVTDYKAFLHELKAKEGEGGVAEYQPPQGEPVVIARHGSYAVLALQKQREALQKVRQGGGSALQPWVAQNDISGVLTTHGLKLLVAHMHKGLAQAKEKTDQLPADQAQILAAYFDGIESFLKAAEANVTAVGEGLRLDAAGNIHVVFKAAFKKGGTFAKASGSVQVPEGGPLAGLPDQPFALAFGGAVPGEGLQALMHSYGQMMSGMLKGKISDDQLKKLTTVLNESGKGIRGIAMMVGVGQATEPLLSGVISVTRVDDAKAYLDRQVKMIKTLSEAFQGGGGGPNFMPAMETKRLKIAGRPAVEVTTDMTANLPVQQLKDIMEKVFGSGGKMIQTTVALDDHRLLTRLGPPQHIMGLIKAAEGKGLAASATVAKVHGMLPEGAQWVGYLNPKGTMDLVTRAVGMFAPDRQMPVFPAGAPPVGFAMKYEAAGMDGHLAIPGATLQAVSRFVQENLMGRAVGQPKAVPGQ